MSAPTPSASGGAIPIVGRPNVGKSAIFNRLVGRRLAIVHDEPGVTRDRIVAVAYWGGRSFEVIDTGGIGLLDRAPAAEEIGRAIEQQVELAIEEAAVVIMAVDVRAGRTPLDDDVAHRLRVRGRPVLVAANKADDPSLDDAAQDFAPLGFPVFPISAEHDRGFDDLMAAAMVRLPPTTTAAATGAALRIVVLGRPNAGKSSYINRLLRHERLVVSSLPGTTRDSVEVPFTVDAGGGRRSYILIDTAGLRASRRLESAVEQFSLARVAGALRRSDVAVLLFDASVGPTLQDKRIARMILEEHRGCVLVANKWDLAAEGLSPAEARRRREAYRDALRRELPFLDFAPLHFISARTGEGVGRTVESFDMVAANVATQIKTGLLNRILRDAFERQSPPSVHGRRLKLFYAVQVGVRPLRFRMFVNQPALLTASYRAYLIGRLRAAAGLEGAPVLLTAESRPRRAGGQGGQGSDRIEERDAPP